MKNFKTFCKNIILEKKYVFGATAYGNADIDKTTALDIKKGHIKPEWQFLGTKNNKLIPGFSVANNRLPFGTYVKIINKKTGRPVGESIGNAQGIYRVEDKGGPNVTNNIDFYSGSDMNLFNYFASIGKDSGNLDVEVLNIAPGSEEEKQILANVSSSGQPKQQVASPRKEIEDYDSPAAAFGGMAQGAGTLFKAMGS
jgi:3D (Asp-Asp-Asp) domain-containing protein